MLPTPGCLDGVRVVDLSRILAGPYCTQILADLGAEVTKIEAPWGDDTRGWGPPFVEGPPGSTRADGQAADDTADTTIPPRESAYHLSCNRGRHETRLDLRQEADRAVVEQLLVEADVLVENFRPGTLDRFGWSPETLQARFPRLVIVSISGFGQTGPRRDEAGYDAALQAITGIMSITGEAAGPPAKVGVAWIDVMTGLWATIGILAALHERQSSGRGQHLDLSLFDVGVSALVNQAQGHLADGRIPHRMGSAHPNLVPYQAFEAADGWMVLAVGSDAQFARLPEALELPELADPRFATNEGRVNGRTEVVEPIARRLAERPRATWLELLKQVGVPASPVNTVAEALADPQAVARGAVFEYEHPALGTVPMLASPLRHLSRTPAGRTEPPR